MILWTLSIFFYNIAFVYSFIFPYSTFTHHHEHRRVSPSVFPRTIKVMEMISRSTQQNTDTSKDTAINNIDMEDIATQIKEAIQLSKSAQTNITAAYQACDLWFDILIDSPFSLSSSLNVDIILTSNALYASVLIRCGKDEDAIFIYTQNLNILKNQNDKQQQQKKKKLWVDTKIGRGYSYQRIMNYQKAYQDFLSVIIGYCDDRNDMNNRKKTDAIEIEKCYEAACSGATCAMRMGDIKKASYILSKMNDSVADFEKKGTDINEIIESEKQQNFKSMFRVIRQIINKNNNTGYKPGENLFDIDDKNDPNLILYKWIWPSSDKQQIVDNDNGINSNFFSFLSLNNNKPFKQTTNNNNFSDNKEWYLRLASINQSFLDDFNLVHLDNKVLLHQLLSSPRNPTLTRHYYWPHGFVFSAKFSSTEDADTIHKDEQQQQILKKKVIDKLLNNNENKNKSWILKKEAGYGSHGNFVISSSSSDNTQSILSDRLDNILSSSLSSSKSTKWLCQELIHPPFLIENRKFSMRVYVVYFHHHYHSLFLGDNDKKTNSNNMACFISPIGLVKLAPSDYYISNSTTNNTIDGNNIKDNYDDTRSQMTNSGRYYSNGNNVDSDDISSNSDTEESLQKDFIFLKNYIDSQYPTSNSSSYFDDVVWKQIKESIQDIMTVYTEESYLMMQSKVQNNKSGKSRNDNDDVEILQYKEWYSMSHSIPKILGFDYILKQEEEEKDNKGNTYLLKPYLMEINRFPGLEPRETMATSTPVVDNKNNKETEGPSSVMNEEEIKYSVVLNAWRIASSMSSNNTKEKGIIEDEEKERQTYVKYLQSRIMDDITINDGDGKNKIHDIEFEQIMVHTR